MSDHNKNNLESNTLNERKEERDELFEMKRLKHGVDEVEKLRFDDDSKKFVPTTKKEKREHFFYYYKFHILAAVLLIVFATVMIYNSATKKKPDVFVFNVFAEYINADDLQAVNDFITEHTPDFNNDKAKVALNSNFPVSEVIDPQKRSILMQRLGASVMVKEGFLFITDKSGFERIEGELLYFDDLSEFTENTEFDNKMIRIPKEMLTTKEGSMLPDELYMGLMKFSNENRKDYINSVDYLKQMIESVDAFNVNAQ